MARSAVILRLHVNRHIKLAVVMIVKGFRFVGLIVSDIVVRLTGHSSIIILK